MDEIKYGIAHRDENGDDFHGIPYLAGYPTSDIEEARKIKTKLIQDGFKYVYIFKILGQKWENTWDYIQSNKVD